MMTYKWIFTQIRSLRIIHLLFKIPCTMYTIRILLHPLHHLLFSPNKRSRCVSTGPPFTQPFRRPLLLPLPDINGIWLILKESRLMSPSCPNYSSRRTEQGGTNEINEDGGREQ